LGANHQSYDTLRLRADKLSRNDTAYPESVRPGNNFKVTAPVGAKVARGAWEIEAGAAKDQVAATITWEQ
jgi:hypothetical protein